MKFTQVAILFAFFVLAGSLVLGQSLPEQEPGNNVCTGARDVGPLPFVDTSPYPAIYPIGDVDFYRFTIDKPGAWMYSEILHGPTFADGDDDILMTLFEGCREALPWHELGWDWFDWGGITSGHFL
jgi:hypothetical protein